MMQFILTTTIVTIISVLTACGETQNRDVSPPKWFVDEPQNTNTTLYGTGQSTDKNESIENALAALKEKIYTSVSSSTFMQDNLVNSTQANEYKKTVKMKTPPINIQNYKIEKSEFRDNIYYTTVSVAKDRVVDLIHDNLIKKSQKLKPQIEQYTFTKNLIKKVVIMNVISVKCMEYVELERFYNALGFAMDGDVCSDSLKEFAQFETKYKVEITNTNPVVYDTLSYIFAKKFTLLQKAPNVVTYSTSIKTTDINGGYLSGVTINIMQHNSEEKYKKNCIGSSNKSQSQSINAAFESCLSQAKTQTFEEFFNL